MKILKFVLGIILICTGVAVAKYKTSVNPYTGKLDYYPVASASVVTVATGTTLSVTCP